MADLILALSLAALQAPPAPLPGAQPARNRANLTSYLAAEDYPGTALARGAQGTVGFRLVIGRDGTVRNCVIESSSGHPDLDRRTCQIMVERARFEPARDASGHPTEDTMSSRITWRIDEGSEPPFEAFRFVRRMVASPGDPLRCTLRVNEGGTEMSGSDCDNFVGGETLRWIRSRGVRIEYTELISFTPGEAAPSGDAPSEYGTLAGEAEAEVTIGGNGRVAQCRELRTQQGGIASLGGLCEFVRNMSGFWRSGGAARSGRIRSSVYVQMGMGI